MTIRRICSVLLCVALLFGVFVSAASSAEKKPDEINPSTWAAIDGLGRTLSLNGDVSDRRENKYVAMFYWTWHYPWIV